MGIDDALIARTVLGPRRMENYLTESARPNWQAFDDTQLMQRYRSGDADAFSALYLRYRDRLHRYILRMVSTAAEAEETFQDVWLAVIRDKARYRPDAKFVTFLFTIAHQRCIDRWRFHERVVEEPILATDANAIADESYREPDRVAQTADNAQALLVAVAQLPALQREAFLLQADGEMTIEDIAQATQTSRETVKSRLRYARRRLRQGLRSKQ